MVSRETGPKLLLLMFMGKVLEYKRLNLWDLKTEEGLMHLSLFLPRIRMFSFFLSYSIAIVIDSFFWCYPLQSTTVNPKQFKSSVSKVQLLRK